MEVRQAFKYCIRCGTKSQTHDKYLHCPSCGLDFYFNPKVAAGVVLFNEKGEILLGKRAYDPGKGLWDTFGGFIDSGENAEQAAARELKEETGVTLKVNDLHYFGSFRGTYEYQKVIYEIVNIVFTAKLPKDVKIVPTEDMADHKFFKIADIKEAQMGLDWHLEFLRALKAKFE